MQILSFRFQQLVGWLLLHDSSWPEILQILYWLNKLSSLLFLCSLGGDPIIENSISNSSSLVAYLLPWKSDVMLFIGCCTVVHGLSWWTVSSCQYFWRHVTAFLISQQFRKFWGVILRALIGQSVGCGLDKENAFCDGALYPSWHWSLPRFIYVVLCLKLPQHELHYQPLPNSKV